MGYENSRNLKGSTQSGYPEGRRPTAVGKKDPGRPSERLKLSRVNLRCQRQFRSRQMTEPLLGILPAGGILWPVEMALPPPNFPGAMTPDDNILSVIETMLVIDTLLDAKHP